MKKKNNAGLSLIEVIVAVSIFSIAAMVLLRGFVTSARINRKSNLYLEATTTAQNIMEEIKAKTFEQVALAFNYPVDNTTGETRLTFLNPQLDKITGGTLGSREVLKTDDGYKDVRLYKVADGEDESKITASIISKDNGNTYKFNPRKSGTNASKYYFELTNVTNNHETFDALVEFDGSLSSGYKKKTSTNSEEGKNDYLSPNISRLDTKTDAFLTENIKEGEEQSKRILYIKIDKSSGTIKVKALTVVGEEVNQIPEDEHYVTFYSAEAGSELKNIYIFYEPNYNSVNSVNPLDEIVIDNTENQDVTIYLVKQRDDENNKPTSLEENQYRMKLTIKEDVTAEDDQNHSNWNTNPSLFKASIKLRTNLDYNISTLYDVDSDINDSESSRPQINQMKLIYQADAASQRMYMNSSAKKVLSCTGLDNREAVDRIYTAKVEIYKQGAAEKGFPEDEMIVSLDGAKEN